MSKELSGLTAVLRAHADGDAAALETLFAACARDLRALARRQLSHERRGHTLQPTALVHEAFLRLFDGKPPDFTDSQSFFTAVAREMRRALTDHARRRLAKKRRGDAVQVPVSEIDVATGMPDALTLVALSEALETLAGEDPRAAAIVDLKFVAGFSNEEVAAALGVTARTVERDWKFARARLHGLLSGT